MDSRSRSLNARLAAGPPLANRLRQQREYWLGPAHARRFGRGWAGLGAALRLAAERTGRWQRFPVLLRGESAYPWRRPPMEFLPHAGQLPPWLGETKQKQPGGKAASAGEH